MKVYVYLVALLIIISSVNVYADNKTDRYEFITTNSDYSLYFDKISYKKNKDIINVWLSENYTPIGAQNIIAGMKERGIEVTSILSFTHKLTHDEYNIKDRTYRSLVIKYYDDNGNVLLSVELPEELKDQWRPIPPNTEVELVFDKLINYKSAKNKKKSTQK